MLKTSDVAAQLGVTASTVRNYTKAFAEYLSPGATPLEGQRQFTDQDLRVLATAKGFLDQGMKYSQAADNLALIDLDTLEELPPPVEEPSTALVPRALLVEVDRRHSQELARVTAERDKALEDLRTLERQVGELTGQVHALQPRPRLGIRQRLRRWWTGDV